MTDVDTRLAPVRNRVRVACDVEHAFRTFTEDVASWWPVRTRSISAGPNGEHPPVSVVFEQSAGGRLYEVAHDGRECDWATILTYEAPHRLVLEWRVNPASPPTEVEVVFSTDGDGTIVVVEHRGWERYEEGGAEARASYDSGWAGVLRLYQGATEK